MGHTKERREMVKRIVQELGIYLETKHGGYMFFRGDPDGYNEHGFKNSNIQQYWAPSLEHAMIYLQGRLDEYAERKT